MFYIGMLEEHKNAFNFLVVKEIITRSKTRRKNANTDAYVSIA